MADVSAKKQTFFILPMSFFVSYFSVARFFPYPFVSVVLFLSPKKHNQSNFHFSKRRYEYFWLNGYKFTQPLKLVKLWTIISVSLSILFTGASGWVLKSWTRFLFRHPLRAESFRFQIYRVLYSLILDKVLYPNCNLFKLKLPNTTIITNKIMRYFVIFFRYWWLQVRVFIA